MTELIDVRCFGLYRSSAYSGYQSAEESGENKTAVPVVVLTVHDRSQTRTDVSKAHGQHDIDDVFPVSVKERSIWENIWKTRSRFLSCSYPLPLWLVNLVFSLCVVCLFFALRTPLFPRVPVQIFQASCNMLLSTSGFILHECVNRGNGQIAGIFLKCFLFFYFERLIERMWLILSSGCFGCCAFSLTFFISQQRNIGLTCRIPCHFWPFSNIV